MERIVNEVLVRMVGLDADEAQKLDAVLHSVLSNYEFTEKKTAISAINDQWMKTLDLFIARKIVDGKSNKTMKLYKMQLSRLLSYLNKTCEEITEADLFQYLAMYKSSRNVSNSYLDDLRRIMTSFFGWLYRKGFIPNDPSSGLDPIKREKIIKKPFTDEELELLRRSCKDEREVALLELLYATGIRVSELVKLNKTDINLDTLEVVVRGKGNKERQTYITQTAKLHIKRYLDLRTDDSEALFVTKRSPHSRLTVGAIQRILKQIGMRVGVEHVHPHRFRRTMATNVLKKGMPIEEVRTILGHVKLETTMIYCTVDQENVRHSHSKYMCA